MLVIKRNVSQKGNSYIVTIPKKELNGNEVIIMDVEAFDCLVNKKDN